MLVNFFDLPCNLSFVVYGSTKLQNTDAYYVPVLSVTHSGTYVVCVLIHWYRRLAL